ncbi:MAG: hypothetical protein FWD75_01970 [Propionibacteriaceae bacterium]|nr:hypothetical protein [Propionibacteriaceae bacterium]
MIAQVYVDVGVPHLDRPFDYLVPEEWHERARAGTRVKVRFSGRSLPGFIVGLADESDVDTLVPLSAIVSDEVVMPASSVALIRAVADHCAGAFMDVARLAIPPRAARAEAATMGEVESSPRESQPCPIDLYPAGTALRTALRSGASPRVTWTVAGVCGPAGDWADGLAGLIGDTLASGRSAILVVPDARDVQTARAAVTRVVEPAHVVTLSADKGPQARYRAFLAGARGHARVVIGTRATVYAPVHDLGLIAVWEEADSSLAEPHFPYPSLRDVVAIRASQTRAAVVFASYSRSTEIQNWVDKAWLHEVAMPSGQASYGAPLVRIASQVDRSLDRDPAAHTSRLPHDAFTVIQKGVASGPVLVWVPWVGHRRNFLCPRCGEVARCSCGGGFEERSSGAVCCQVCARPAAGWRCSCGSTRWWAVTTGSARTADELATSFRTIPVLRSDSTHPVDGVGAEPCIVISTPGCEPHAEGGYAAAVILDASGFLSRPDIRVGEEAVRRWMSVMPLVRSGRDGGTVLIVGPPQDRAVQAVVRQDPAGFARRELQDRQEAGFPPSTRMATFTGDEAALTNAATQLTGYGYVELIGPVQEIDSDDFRLIARVPANRGEDFARHLGEMAAKRSQGKKSGTYTWRLDPVW